MLPGFHQQWQAEPVSIKSNGFGSIAYRDSHLSQVLNHESKSSATRMPEGGEKNFFDLANSVR